MCGIIGYIGEKDLTSVLLVGLERLSYRGYDSSGIAVVSDTDLSVWKEAGKIHDLEQNIKNLKITGNLGIGHTRWATHGKANNLNAHPHTDNDKQIAIVHNGIIENHRNLRDLLIKQDVIIHSETDSELLAHLLAQYMKEGLCLEKAVYQLIQVLEGSFAIAAICETEPDKIIVCKKDSPLVIGIGNQEYFISSDMYAISPQCKNVICLDNLDVAIIQKDQLIIKDKTGALIQKQQELIPTMLTESKKGNYDYFMLKEIHEQPDVIKALLTHYIKDNELVLNLDALNLESANRFIIQACGTSWHAGLVGKFYCESAAYIPTEVDYSSEFRYRQMINGHHDVMLTLSQSGETADTLACLREAKRNHFSVLAFVNVQGSSIDRESDASLYSLAGQEIGVASTKNYSAQLLCLYLFSLYMGKVKQQIKADDLKHKLQKLQELPVKISQVLDQEQHIKAIADKYADSKEFLFVGRNLNYPTALEGALKLKEISYIHATGYPAGELKHGPIALIDEHLPIVCIAPTTSSYQKMASNIEEIKARKGRIILITTAGNPEAEDLAEDVIYVPNITEDLSPFLCIIPLQLLSYYIALKRGCNVDQPRNLAKSVTVE